MDGAIPGGAHSLRPIEPTVDRAGGPLGDRAARPPGSRLAPAGRVLAYVLVVGGGLFVGAVLGLVASLLLGLIDVC